MAHARLSPSNHRWPNCPGSIREEAKYPDVSGAAAIDGTGSHLLHEMCLDQRKHAAHFLGQTIGEGHPEKPEGWVVDQARCDRVQVSIDYLGRRYADFKTVDVFESESSSSPGHYLAGRNDWWGTVDVTIIGVLKNGRIGLDVIDYKDGFQFVEVEDNSQLIAYAAGKLAYRCTDGGTIDMSAVAQYDVRLTIVQPKNEWDPIRFQNMTGIELLDKAQVLVEAAAKTDDPDAPLIAGDWCKWCKHRDNCAEKVAQSTSAMTTVGSLNIAINEMSNEQLTTVLENKALITELFDNVEAEMMTRLRDGQSIPGYMIGHGPSKKQWRDDEETIAKKLKGIRFLKDDIYPSKFVTPAQALKHPDLTDRQKKRLEEEMIEVIRGTEKLAKTKVKLVTAEEMFADVKPETPAETPKKDLSKLSFL